MDCVFLESIGTDPGQEMLHLICRAGVARVRRSVFSQEKSMVRRGTFVVAAFLLRERDALIRLLRFLVCKASASASLDGMDQDGGEWT